MSAFTLQISVPRHVRVEGGELERDAFFEWLWGQLGPALVGVHEGTLLSEEAVEKGVEPDSWTVDAGEAPANRDWVSAQVLLEAELYFSSRNEAERGLRFLENLVISGSGLILKSGVVEQASRDWDADWKASFLNNGKGVAIAPFWRIVPPWKDTKEAPSEERWLKINPGAGFGTGTHETTQLCMEALGEEGRKRGASMFVGSRILDFGSGSGILAISAALLGAQVDAVEVDKLAIENANENSEINAVLDSIRYATELPSEGSSYEVVVANILRPILLKYMEELCGRIATPGVLILSGLIEGDIKEVSQHYSRKLGVIPEVRRLNEWRALVFRRGSY